MSVKEQSILYCYGTQIFCSFHLKNKTNNKAIKLKEKGNKFRTEKISIFLLSREM